MLFPYFNVLDPTQSDNGDFADIVMMAQAGNTIHQALGILLGIVGIGLLFNYGRHLRVRGAVGILLIGYISWITLSITWSDASYVSVRREGELILLLIFCAGCAAALTERGIARFVIGTALLNILCAGLQEIARGTFNPFAAGSRFSGTVSPNIQGASLSLALLLICWFAWHSRGARRIGWYSTAAVVGAFIVMTGSRTSWIGLTVAIAVSLILTLIRMSGTRRWEVIAALILLGIVASLLAYVVHPESSRIAALAGTLRTERDVGEVTDLTGRDQIWDVCAQYATERPLTGYGYGAFWTRSRLDEVADELKWPAAHAHSAYLDVFLASGVPGTILFVLLLVATLFVCLKRYFSGQDIYVAWAALLVFTIINGITESIIVLPTFPAFVLCLLWMKLSLQSVHSPIRA